MKVSPERKSGLCQIGVCLQGDSDDPEILMAFQEAVRVVEITVFLKRLHFLIDWGWRCFCIVIVLNLSMNYRVWVDESIWLDTVIDLLKSIVKSLVLQGRLGIFSSVKLIVIFLFFYFSSRTD